MRIYLADPERAASAVERMTAPELGSGYRDWVRSRVEAEQQPPDGLDERCEWLALPSMISCVVPRLRRSSPAVGSSRKTTLGE